MGYTGGTLSAGVITAANVNTVTKEMLFPPQLNPMTGKWEVFTKNMATIKDQDYRVTAYNCLSSLNIFYCVDFYKWAVKNFGNEVHSQFVTDQEMLDISHLPKYAKDQVLGKIANHKGEIFDSIRAKLNMEKDSRRKELLNYIERLDQIRNTNYPETFKEWYKILQKK